MLGKEKNPQPINNHFVLKTSTKPSYILRCYCTPFMSLIRISEPSFMPISVRYLRKKMANVHKDNYSAVHSYFSSHTAEK